VAKPTAEVAMRWTGTGIVFEGSGLGRPAIAVDGDGKTATSPVELLLLSAATCAASDVVLILQKQRVQLASLEVNVRGTRRETTPRRYTDIALEFRISGEGADEAKARRAVELSVEKYCSVMSSLAPDINISYDVTLA
jgi:putative redox protein